MKNTSSEKYKTKQNKKKRRKNAHTWLQRLGRMTKQHLTNAGVFCWPGEQTSGGEEKEVYQADGFSEAL